MDDVSNPIKNGWDLDSLMLRRMFNLPPKWQVCGIQTLDKNRPGLGVIYEGAVPVGEYKSGPRKGWAKWPPGKDCQTFTVLKSEIDSFRKAWELETGICSECFGKGRTAIRIFARSDEDYRTCKRCDGTGNAWVEVTA